MAGLGPPWSPWQGPGHRSTKFQKRVSTQSQHRGHWPTGRAALCVPSSAPSRSARSTGGECRGGGPGRTAPHLVVPLVGGGALATRNADAQASRLAHDGKCQLETEQTRGVRGGPGRAELPPGPVRSSDGSARAGSGVTDGLEGAGTAGRTVTAQGSREGSSPGGVPVWVTRPEAPQTGWRGKERPAPLPGLEASAVPMPLYQRVSGPSGTARAGAVAGGGLPAQQCGEAKGSPQPGERSAAEQSEYRPLPPQCERALSAGYWPGQTTPPVRTGPARHAGEPPPGPAPAGEKGHTKPRSPSTGPSSPLG